jgi:hypothetical protein
MKQKIQTSVTRARGRLIYIGVVLGGAFWIIESIMHVYVFHGHDLVDSIFFPEVHEAWMRLIIAGMFISFGIYGQWLSNAWRTGPGRLEPGKRRTHPLCHKQRPCCLTPALCKTNTDTVTRRGPTRETVSH